MSNSLDIRVDDEDFTEQNAPNQEEEKENVFPNNIISVERTSAVDPTPPQITKESTLPNIESSITIICNRTQTKILGTRQHLQTCSHRGVPIQGRWMVHKRKGWFSWKTNAQSTTRGRQCVSPNDRILPTRPCHQGPGKNVSFDDDVPPVLTGTTTCSCISQTKVSREIALVTRYGPLPGVSGI